MDNNQNKILRKKYEKSLTSFNLTTFNSNFTFEQLAEMVARGDIAIPEIQRGFVWSEEQASKFIESLIMGIPIPSIIFAVTDDNNYLVVDGLQRLSTISSFIKGHSLTKFSNFDLTSKKPWKLKGNVSKEIVSKTFDELDDVYRRKISYSTIPVVIFKDNNHDDSALIEIFSRINREGSPLNRQEIRNSIYNGFFNNSLKSINENENWRLIFGKEKTSPRMDDIELLARIVGMKIARDLGEFSKIKNFSITDLIDNTYYYFTKNENDFANYKNILINFINIIGMNADIAREWNKEKNKYKSTCSKTILEAYFILHHDANDYKNARENMQILQSEFQSIFEFFFSEATNSVVRLNQRLEICYKALSSDKNEFRNFIKNIKTEV